MTSLTSPGFRSVGFRDMGSPAAFGPVPGAIAYYRFDEGRNLLKYSQDFDNAAWTKSRVSVAPNAAISPDGTATADTIIEDSTTNQHQIYQTFTVTGGICTCSVYAKQATGTRYLTIYPQATSGGWAIFDLVAGVKRNAGGAGHLSSDMVSLGNGWYRCWVTFTTTAGNGFAVIYLTPDVISPAQVYAGDGVSGIHVVGAQISMGPIPPTYYPTTDNQTLHDYSGNGNQGVLGSTAGVDTNDPQWTGTGLLYGADDYVKFGPIRNAAGITQNLGSMSMAFYVPGAISAASTKTCSYSIGAGKAIYFGAVSGAPANNIITVQYAAGSYSSWCSATDTIPVGWHTLAVNWNGLLYDIYIDGIPKPVTTAGTPALLSLTDANCCYDGTIFGISGLIRAERLIYPVGLSYSDLMQARLIMASDAAQKGVILP